MEEVLSLCQKTLKKFLLSLSVADQHIVSLEAKITFLKNPKAGEADYHVPEDKEEEDVNTIINNGAGEQIPQGEEVTWDQDHIRSNHFSPPVSMDFSKTTKLNRKSYQAWKKRINDLLDELEENSPSIHSEHLKEQASMLSSMLKSMEIDKIISLCKSEPDCFSIFGETKANISDWHLSTEVRIEELLIKASKEVAERKSATQSGFRKLAYPSFNGYILNYLKFKKLWKEEVVPERKAVTLELAALREAVSVIAKGKIIDVSSLTEAWKLLDLEYRDAQDIQAKLKDQVRSIKLKASRDSANLVELFHTIQTIAAKIRLLVVINLLKIIKNM